MFHACLQQLDIREERCYTAYLSEQAVELTHRQRFLSSPTYTVNLFLNNCLPFFKKRNLIYYQRIHNSRKISPQASPPSLRAKFLVLLLYFPALPLALLPCLAASTFEEKFNLLHLAGSPGCSSCCIMVPSLRDLLSFSEPWLSSCTLITLGLHSAISFQLQHFLHVGNMGSAGVSRCH